MKIIAHRCGYKESKLHENSLEALNSIKNKNYINGIELDINITKDNKIIIIHNTIIRDDKRLKKINNLTYEELNKIYYKNNKIYLNTLDEMLSNIPKDKEVFIEIKKINSKIKLCRLLKELNIILNKYKNHKITILSFILNYLNLFRLNNKEISTCLLIDKRTFLKFSNPNKNYCNKQIDMISLSKSMINKKRVKYILSNNKYLGIYTINNIEEYKNIINKIGKILIEKYDNYIYITTNIAKEIGDKI